MSSNDKPLPTDAEYRVLDVLWARGPSTVRDVHEAVQDEWRVRYTTVLKILQNLHGKGLVSRDDSERSHVYDALVEREWATEGFVDELTRRVFDGSAAELAMRALSTKRATPEELEAVRALIDRLEAEGR